jgi:hypothetical protein
VFKVELFVVHSFQKKNFSGIAKKLRMDAKIWEKSDRGVDAENKTKSRHTVKRDG